ncbi:type I pullulanase [Paenibacillus sp.]|uniref:type I pullulanase n=1 Tax=Paenibacillus sp. TaxID=58172 RepID=UPI002D5AC504|nr:type I pullulanase [Paenibacillus sp.]HZG56325.1 type I pullulanase [Paenibacillus sp.]
MFLHIERATIVVHYCRFDGDYEGWNVWAWPDGRDGASFPFAERDGFGAKARVSLEHMSSSTRIGLLLRRSTGSDDWADREGAFDRYIEETDASGAAEVWIVEGDERLYRDETLAKARCAARIVEATMVSTHAVRVRTNRRVDDRDAATLELENEDGAKIEVCRVEREDGGRTVVACAAAPLSLAERYVVRLSGLRANVTLRGMFDTPEFERLYVYDGDDLGARCSMDGTTFRLWAPTAERAELIVFEGNDASEGVTHPMARAERGTWTVRLPGDLHGTLYLYRVEIDGEWRQAVDPYARSLSANGRRGAVLDPSRAAPPGWETDARPPLAAPTDAILYELHVRDATMHPASGAAKPGTFLGLAEEGSQTPGGLPTGLDYLASLGVTHVQLLPVNDFVSVDETDRERLYNWGYDPAFWFAPEGSYATDPHDPGARVREFKRLVLGLHRRGLRVSLDVVFNHQFSAARSALERLVPGYYFRSRPDGSLANGTGVGNDTASERAMMRKLIVDAVEYWAREYRVDGFRFDLMGIHDVETMRAVRERLDGVDPSILVYGEGWVMDTPLAEERKAALPNARALPRIGFFHDRFRDGVRGGVFDAAERGFVGGEGARAHDVWTGVVGGIDYGRGIVGHASEPEQTINYVEVHDNHTLWDKLASSNAEDDEAARAAMQRLATSILLTSQGIPLLHAGQEWLRTKGGEHNSYRAPDDVNRLDWLRAERYEEHIDYVRGLIELRKAHAVFRLPSAEAIRARLRVLDTERPGLLAYALDDANGSTPGVAEWVVAHNALRVPAALRLPTPGAWRVYCDGLRASPLPFGDVVAGEALLPPLSTIVWARG